MPAICLYFQVHQPFRLRRYSFFDLGFSHKYEDDGLNEEILHRVADRCYLPTNTLLQKLVEETEGKFQVTLSLSGLVMEQLMQYRPEALGSFADLAKHKGVEFLGETYYHSLASLYDEEEFYRQVKMHQKALKEHLGREATVFRNSELIYSDALGQRLKAPYQGVLAEGVHWHLQGNTFNSVYKVPKSKGKGLLLRNAQFSDAIAFHYHDHKHDVEGLVRRISEEPGEVVNLFLDYETFGEHLRQDEGIHEFLEAFVKKALERKMKFTRPEKVIEKAKKPPKLSMPTITSWADEERDASAWNGNEMQRQALKRVYALGAAVRKADDPKWWDIWGRLQTTDHFYYMSTKRKHDGEVHNYFNPFDSPYDAYIHYMNILSDLELRINERKPATV